MQMLQEDDHDTMITKGTSSSNSKLKAPRKTPVRVKGHEDAVDALLPGAGLGLDDGVALLVHFRSILRHTRADRFWLLATWGRALYVITLRL